MIVECEKCSGKFKLDDSKVTEKGIKVRCSKCKHVFTVKKPSSGLPEFSTDSAGPSEDPFQDFSFSDDIDLGGEPEVPSETERAPSPPPSSDRGPGLADEGGKAPASPGGSDNFGAFDFEENSFDTAPPPTSPAKSGKASPDKEWGEVSFSDDMPQMPDEQAGLGDDFDLKPKAGAGKAEEESFGDFKFDDGGAAPGFDFGGEADLGKPDQPEPRPSRAAPGPMDDLEASLDTDTDAAAKPSVGVIRDQPAKPVIKHAPRETGKSPLKAIGYIVAVVAVIGGVLFYLNSQGTFTFSDLTSGNFGKLKNVPVIQKALVSLGLMEEPDIGTVEVVEGSVKVFTIQREAGGSILVITGQVRNTFRKAKSFIQVEARLYNEAKDLLVSKMGYCDVTFTGAELATLPRETIDDFMNTRSGRNTANHNVKQGGTRDFTVVFFSVPPELHSYKVEVVDYINSDAL